VVRTLRIAGTATEAGAAAEVPVTFSTRYFGHQVFSPRRAALLCLHSSSSTSKTEYTRLDKSHVAGGFWCKVEDAQRPGGWNSGKMSKRSSLDELFKGCEIEK
jgi:hypothetical protein